MIPTTKISQFVDHFIAPLVPLRKYYIRDSNDMINIFNGMVELPPQTIFSTLDVNNFYTNIPHKEQIYPIKEVLSVHRPPHEYFIVVTSLNCYNSSAELLFSL